MAQQPPTADGASHRNEGEQADQTSAGFRRRVLNRLLCSRLSWSWAWNCSLMNGHLNRFERIDLENLVHHLLSTQVPVGG